MKGLKQFNRFDADGFFKDKIVLVIADEPWWSYKDNRRDEVIGVRYKCIIAIDNTDYGEKYDLGLNEGSEIVIKVPSDVKSYQKFQRVSAKGIKASTYGDYDSELSVEADDVIFQHYDPFSEKK